MPTPLSAYQNTCVPSATASLTQEWLLQMSHQTPVLENRQAQETPFVLHSHQSA
jgi:hypothetical protein